MPRKLALRSIAIALALGCLALPAAAAPSSIGYTGRLSDAQLQPISGSYAITLRIFDAATSGAMLLEQANPAVSVTDGHFHVAVTQNDLAGGGSLETVFASGDELYWEVVVDGDVLSPRQRISSVPWALASNVMAALSSGVSCPTGEALTGLSASGTPTCVPVLQSLPGGVSCSAGHVLAAISSSGDPTCVALPTSSQLANAQDAYNWGNHATAGYLTSESDPSVGLQSQGGWCVSDGGVVNCTQAAPLLAESDPTVNDLGTAPLTCGPGQQPRKVRSGLLTWAWACVPGDAVNVLDFGAVPDDAAGDQNAIFHAFCFAWSRGIRTVLFPHGVYVVNTVNSVVPPLSLPTPPALHTCESTYGLPLPAAGPPSIRLRGEGTAVIRQESVARDVLLDFSDVGARGIPDLEVENLTLDGNKLAAVGLRVYSSTQEALPKVRSLRIDGLRLLDLRQEPGISTAAAGLNVDATYSVVSIRNTVVDGVTRHAGGAFCTGIEVSNLVGTALVENIQVRNVRTPTDIDADGLKIFGRAVNGARQGKATVRDSQFVDCEGRAVKFQLDDVVAENNTIEQRAGKTITNYHAVDAQIGGGRISHNRVQIGASVALGGSAAPFVVQLENSTGVSSATPRVAVIESNVVNTDRRVPYFATLLHPQNANGVARIVDNVIAPLSGAANAAAVATFLQYTAEGGATEGHLTLLLERNVMWTDSHLLYLRKDSTGDFVDLTGKLDLVVDGNRNNLRVAPSHPDFPEPRFAGALFRDPANFKIERLTVRGNEGWGNTTWYGFLDATKLGDGTSLQYGVSGASGGLVNGHPTRSSWLVIERHGQVLRSQTLDGSDVQQNGFLSSNPWPQRSAWTDLQPDVNALGLANLNCTPGEGPRWNGTTWACARDVVNVRDFGAIAGDSIDDQSAIRRAICRALVRNVGTVVFPNGRYLVAGNATLNPGLDTLAADCPDETVPATLAAPSLRLVGLGEAVLERPTSSAPSDFFFNFASTTTIPELSFENLTFDGNDRIATAVKIGTGAASRPNVALSVRNCRFVRLRQASGISTAAAGLSAVGAYTTVTIRDSVVDGVSRDASGSFCSGFGVSGFLGQATVENVIVRNVTTPTDAYADGVLLYGRDIGGRWVGKAIVRDSTFVNCEGSAVKFQLIDAVAENNTVEHTSGKTITNYHAFDAQLGGGRLTNNRVVMGNGVAYGASSMPFLVQLESSGTANDGPRQLVVEGNSLLTNTRIAYFAGITHPTTADAIARFLNNVVAPISGAPSTAQVATFVQYQFNPSTAARKHLTLVLRDNLVRSDRRFLYFRNDAPGGETDMTANLDVVVEGNRNALRADPVPPATFRMPLARLFDGSETVKLDDLTVRGNDGWSNATWYGYLDATRLGEGSSLLVGVIDPVPAVYSGTLQNGHPTRTQWVIVERNGSLLRSSSIDGSDAWQVGVVAQATGPALRGPWRRVD